METLQFRTHIAAPPERVWDVMLTDATYRDWTTAFHPGSRFEGEWRRGATMRFLGPEDGGGASGLVSEVVTADRPRVAVVRHLGFVQGGQDVTDPAVVGAWAGALERCTLHASGDGTDLVVDVDAPDEETAGMHSRSWPPALARLTELCEA